MGDSLSRRLASLEPETRMKAMLLLGEAKLAGLLLTVTQARRTTQEQADLYARGRTKPGPRVTNAKPGESPHNFGLAFDVCFLIEGKPSWDEPRPGAWEEIGRMGEALRLVWGGSFKSFKDRPHFEEPEWKAKAQAMVEAGR